MKHALLFLNKFKTLPDHIIPPGSHDGAMTPTSTVSTAASTFEGGTVTYNFKPFKSH